MQLALQAVLKLPFKILAVCSCDTSLCKTAVLCCHMQQVRSIWLLIYPLMGVSSWRIYINPQPHAVALALYVALLVATWLCWPPIFLPHKPQAGLLDLAGEVGSGLMPSVARQWLLNAP